MTDQPVGDRATDHAGGNQADGVAGDSQFVCVLNAQLFDEKGCPGQGGADTAREGNRAHHQARLGIEPECLGHAHAQQVLHNDEDAREHQQDQQRSPTLDQLAYIRLQADAGKEIQQQRIAHVQVEIYLDIEAVIKKGCHGRTNEAPDDRFGNAVLAQEGVVLDDRLAQKKQQDGEREAHEAMNRKKLGGHR
ncbi:hypothetical protein D3C80_1067740 [compost metagenome]